MKKQILPAPSKKVLCLFLTVFTAILTPQGRAASYTWNTINAGNWSDTSANGWNTSGFPNGAGDAAVFSQAFGGAKTFTLDGDNITLGALTFNNTTGNFPLTLTRSGSQTITFDAFGSGPAFLKWAGAPNVDQTHTAINVPITLNDDLVAIGVTALDLVGNITGTGKKISVYSAPAGPAQLRFLGDNTALTGGIVVNVNSAVQFNSLKAMGGGGSGNVFIANGATATLGYNPGGKAFLDSAIAKIDANSAGMFGIGVAGSGTAFNYDIDLSGITNIRFGSQYSTVNLMGGILSFDFAHNGNNYALGGSTIGGSTLNVSGVNYFTGAHNLDLRAQTLNVLSAQNYSGDTIISVNPTGVANASGPGLTLSGSGTLLNTSSVVDNVGTGLTLDNTGTALQNYADRLNDAAAITLNGGKFIYKGATLASTNSSETVGNLVLGSNGQSLVTITYGGSNTAQVTAANLTRTAGFGTIFVNGVNLGMDSTSTANVARLKLTAAPVLVGTTDATSTGINSSKKDTKIVPFLVGAVTQATGGFGTAATTANTFVTYNATTGLRPLNPTDEFSNNTIVAGNNIYVTAATTATVDASINSLVINGAGLAITAGKTLSIASGALLFVTQHNINTSGTLGFGATEALITVNSGLGVQITTKITGSGGLTKGGSGSLFLGGANTLLSGAVNIVNGTLQISASNNLGDGSATNTIGLSGGGVLDAFSNSFDLGVNRTITLSGAGSLQSDAGALTVSGAVNNGGNTLTLNVNAAGASINIGGVIGNGTGGLLKSGLGTAVLKAANTYSGVTVINSGTLQLGDGTSGNDGTIANSASVVNNANLVFNRYGSTSYGGVIDGTGTLTKLGSGTETLSGANIYTGATKVSAGTLRLGVDNTLPSGTDVSVGDTATAGILDLQGYSTAIKSLAFNIGTGSVNFTLGLNTSARLAVGGDVNLANGFIGFNNTPDGTVGKYTLIKAGGNLTGSATSSSAPSAYRLAVVTGAGGEVDLIHKATIAFSAVTSSTNVHVDGQSTVVRFRLSNTAPNNSDSLSYAVTGAVSTTGNLAANSSTVLDAAVTAVAGVNTVSGTTSSTGVFETTNGIQTATATVTGYNFAAAVSHASVDVGAVMFGTSKMAGLALENTAAAGAYTETLSVTGTSGLSSGFAVAGSVSGLAGGATNNGGIQVGLGSGLAAGEQNGSVTLAMQSDEVAGSGLGHTVINSQVVDIKGHVYNGASLSANGLNAVSASGADTASAKIGAISWSNAQAGFSAANSGTLIDAGASRAVASFNGSDKLNGVYRATATLGYDNRTAADGAIAGGAGYSAVLDLSATVAGNTSSSRLDNKTAQILNGGGYAGYGLISGLARERGAATEAQILGGTASATATVSMAYVSPDEFINPSQPIVDSAARISDIVSITGMPSVGEGMGLTDQFVLQISYSGTQPGYVAWYDTTMSKFVNAIEGNSIVDGRDMGDQAYNGETMYHLGYYGYDSENHVAWAVVDHNSDFAVMAEVVPEPATWAMLFGGLGVLGFWQGMRRRANG